MKLVVHLVVNQNLFCHCSTGAIRRRVELEHFTDDEQYLRLLRNHLERALNEFTPDVLVYNAGTDILDGDPLGNLSISAQVQMFSDKSLIDC